MNTSTLLTAPRLLTASALLTKPALLTASDLLTASGLFAAAGPVSEPESLPVIPAQPNLPDYGFGFLALFESYTRASYLAAFGVQAPNWDATQAPKAWFDTSGTSPSTYLAPNLLAASGSSAVQPLTVIDAVTGQPRALTLEEAAAVNIPGLISYPPYVIAPSDAIQPSTGAILNPTYLSTFAQAVQLAIAWGVPATFGVPGATIVDMDPGGDQAYVYPATEARRWYGVIFNGLPLTVGTELAQMNSQGVGYPGQWNLAAAVGPTFEFSAALPDGISTGVAPAGSAIPCPIRALLPTEYFEQVLGGSEILNTNLIQPPSATGGTVTVGDFTSADRATLASMQAQIAAIAKAIGITP
jgi:hypothetical protein